MIRKITLSAIGIIFILVGATANAQRRAGETIDDKTLGVTVKAALIDNDAVDSGKINVEVYQGVVQLSGYLRSNDQKSAAIEQVRRIDGVKQVADALVVMNGHRTFGRTIDDQRIHAAVLLAVGKVAGMDDAIGVAAHVREGEVLLSGFVDGEGTRDAIVEATEGVSDVKKVHNMITLKP